MNQNEYKQQEAILAVAYGHYEKEMNTHAFFRINNHTIGQDMVQDTFIKTWGYLAHGGKIDLMRPFLYRVLNHLIIDEYRKHKTTSLDALLENGFEPSFDDSARMFDIVDGTAVMRLIQNLPTKYQKVAHMRHAQDLSLKEISVLTGQSRNTIAVQIYRGLEKLRALYYASRGGNILPVKVA